MLWAEIFTLYKFSLIQISYAMTEVRWNFQLKDTLASENANFRCHGENKRVSPFYRAGIKDSFPVSENSMTSSLIT